jgi:hypothetical protein
MPYAVHRILYAVWPPYRREQRRRAAAAVANILAALGAPCSPTCTRCRAARED